MDLAPRSAYYSRRGALGLAAQRAAGAGTALFGDDVYRALIKPALGADARSRRWHQIGLSLPLKLSFSGCPSAAAARS